MQCGEAFAAKFGSPSSRERVPLAEEAFQLTIQSLCQSSFGDVFADQEEVKALSHAYHVVRACLANLAAVNLLAIPSLPLPSPPLPSPSPSLPSLVASAGQKWSNDWAGVFQRPGV